MSIFLGTFGGPRVKTSPTYQEHVSGCFARERCGSEGGVMWADRRFRGRPNDISFKHQLEKRVIEIFDRFVVFCWVCCILNLKPAGFPQIYWVQNSKVLQDIFGCKPFAGPQPTWSEVANRLIYIAQHGMWFSGRRYVFFWIQNRFQLVGFTWFHADHGRCSKPKKQRCFRHNMRRLDSGSEPFFGDFTVVFNSSFAG